MKPARDLEARSIPDLGGIGSLITAYSRVLPAHVLRRIAVPYLWAAWGLFLLVPAGIGYLGVRSHSIILSGLLLLLAAIFLLWCSSFAWQIVAYTRSSRLTR
jgi:hypothetical protein